MLGSDCLVLAQSATNAPAVETQRPSHWATPIIEGGITNMFKVSDSLYRSAQPTAEGFKQLPGMGIRTVFNLREVHEDTAFLKDTGIKYEQVRFATWHPESEDVIKFLRVVTSTSSTPVLVHCRYGADRTGMMCAIYRIVIQGWTKDDAIKEMTSGGYGFHEMWENLIKFIRELDVGDTKRRLLEKK